MAEQVLEVYKNQTDEKTISFLDSNGDPLPITGATVYFSVKASLDDTAYVIEKVITSHTDPAGGVTLLTLTTTDTNIDAKSYHFDIVLLQASGNKRTVLQGKFAVKQGVTA